MLSSIPTLGALCAFAAPLVTAQVGGSTSQLLTNVTVFEPPSNYTIPRTLYARVRKLDCDGGDTLLATWENYLPTDNNEEVCPPNCPENPYIPIYESHDLGETWSERAKVYDTQNGWGLRYQPELYELTSNIGNYSTGTLLLVANSIPADLSQTKLDVYASTDKGFTWNFVSSPASGGYAVPNNDVNPIWEPFLLEYNGELILYYADQREDGYVPGSPEENEELSEEEDDGTLGQKIVHQTTTDLRSWSPVVDDVRYENATWRPGMPVVSELPYGQYMYTFEFFGAEEGEFAVYYRISRDPREFASAPDMPIVSTDGTVPIGSPYNVWTPAGGPLGTIVVSDGNNRELFLNHNLGGGAWTAISTEVPAAYTRGLLVMPENPGNIMVIGGGPLGGEDNSVTISVVNIEPNMPSQYQCSAGSGGNATAYGRR